jgi:FAD dependent oxidoreductase
MHSTFHTPLLHTFTAPLRYTTGYATGNSGIVHAGYDDKPGSVRAKFCWKGNQMFAQLDRELHFGYQRSGSLVVAHGPAEATVLQELMERGRVNGVQNLRIIDRAELREREPHIHPEATAALYSPDAGTLTPYEFSIALAENAADNGVDVRIRRRVTAIQRQDDDGSFVLSVDHWEPRFYCQEAVKDTQLSSSEAKAEVPQSAAVSPAGRTSFSPSLVRFMCVCVCVYVCMCVCVCMWRCVWLYGYDMCVGVYVGK